MGISTYIHIIPKGTTIGKRSSIGTGTSTGIAKAKTMGTRKLTVKVPLYLKAQP